ALAGRSAAHPGAVQPRRQGQLGELAEDPHAGPERVHPRRRQVMMTRTIRMLVLLVGLWGAAAVAQQQDEVPAGSQPADLIEASRNDQAARQKVQPLNNAPVWRAVNSPTAGFTNLPANEGGVLIQSAGEDWRQLRNGPVTQYGGWALVAVLLIIAAYYLLHGPFKVSGAPTGRMIERFTVVERITHWLNAACFVLLALTGIVML